MLVIDPLSNTTVKCINPPYCNGLIQNVKHFIKGPERRSQHLSGHASKPTICVFEWCDDMSKNSQIKLSAARPKSNVEWVDCHRSQCSITA